MQVFVHLASGSGNVRTFEMNSSDSVSLLKIKFWALEGIPPWDLRLIFAGTQLPVERTLASCNIRHCSKINTLWNLH
jgi:hypothetical protein